MTAGVAHAAIERGLISALDPITKVRIRNLNTNSLIETVVQTPQGEIIYDGNTSIDGVPGTAAPVVMNFMEVIGSKTGQLLPTGYCREKNSGN